MDINSRCKSKSALRAAATWTIAIGLVGGSSAGLASSGNLQKTLRPAASRARIATGGTHDDGRVMVGAHSRAALTVQWWRWLYSIPIGVAPGADTTGVNCGINQQGDAWFLAGPLSGFDVTCTVPAGKTIVSAVFAFLDDYPCPPGIYLDGSLGPAPGQSLEEFLLKDAAPFIDGAVAAAQLDGRPLTVRRIMSHVFGFTAAASVNASDICVTGSPQLGVSDGYFVFIEPPQRGDHLLELSWVSPSGEAATGTVHLKIR
jgi:hypothetical protein